MIKNLINHVVFVIDASGSMSHIKNDVIKVFDSQVSYLAQRSKELNQETRVSVYLFNYTTECLIYDTDVLRLPSIKEFYSPRGGTALIDGAIKAIEDLNLTPEIYGDHAFLIYVLTDGEENGSKNNSSTLSKRINDFAENWTMAALVPDSTGVFEAKKFGFPANNIQIWNTSSKGMSEAGNVIKSSTDTFMQNRARGIRGTKNLFTLDTSALNKTKVTRELEQLKTNEYELLPVHKESVIQPFVESWTRKPYVKGSCYYQLTKAEKVQNYKQVCLQEKTTGKVYSGTNARDLLGLPDYEVKVDPSGHPKFDIFIQSTSLNRKLVGGTKLIVLK